MPVLNHTEKLDRKENNKKQQAGRNVKASLRKVNFLLFSRNSCTAPLKSTASQILTNTPCKSTYLHNPIEKGKIGEGSRNRDEGRFLCLVVVEHALSLETLRGKFEDP